MARFTLPRDLYHGKGSIEVLKTLKGKKAMVCVGGGSMRRFGFLDRIEAYLKEAGMEVAFIEGIEPDPSVETVMKGAKIGIEAHVNFVIGIGGGSPMDAAKAIALMIANPEDNESLLYESRPAPHLPVVAVPTTAGTGSEVTPWAVITRHSERTKRTPLRCPFYFAQ